MKFSQNQLDTISKYCSDISKIVVGSVVVSFFIQTESMNITPITFIVGSLVAVFFFGFGVILSK